MEEKSIQYYDLFPILKEMESRRFIPRHFFIRDYLIPHGVSNDTIFELDFNYYVCTNKEDVYRAYFEEVNRMLGLPEENGSLMVRVSW